MSNQTEQGSFITGFTIGLFAGAAGYFLFATDKGEKVRKKLADEWNVAQKQWVENQELAEPAGSLRDVVKDFFTNLFADVLEDEAAKQHAKKGKTTSPEKTEKKASPKKLVAPKKNTFKGV